MRARTANQISAKLQPRQRLGVAAVPAVVGSHRGGALPVRSFPGRSDKRRARRPSVPRPRSSRRIGP